MKLVKMNEAKRLILHYLSRKAGSISGNTYHEGKNPGTNPKIFILISGTIKFSTRHKNFSDIEKYILSTPCVMSIPPFIIHKIEAITDIIMLECNSIADIQQDRYKLDVEIA